MLTVQWLLFGIRNHADAFVTQFFTVFSVFLGPVLLSCEHPMYMPYVYAFIYNKSFYICVHSFLYIYICMCVYIRIHNAPALPACNWSKARLVPPLGWTNGYAQAKANPCASSSTAITTSSSSSNNVLLLLLHPGDRTEIVTVDSCEAKNAKIGCSSNRNFVKSRSAAQSNAHHSFAY